MKAMTTTQTTVNTQAMDQQAAQVGMGMIVAFSALSGIWGATCLLSAIAQHGIAQMVIGWCQAILG